MKFGQFWDYEEEKRRQLEEQRRAQENALYPNAEALVAEIESVIDWYYDVANETFDTATRNGVYPTKSKVRFKFEYCHPGIDRVNFFENHEVYLGSPQGYDTYKDDWQLLFYRDFNHYTSKFYLTERIFDILKVQPEFANPYNYVYVDFIRMSNGKSFFKFRINNLKRCDKNVLGKLGCDKYLKAYEDDFENHVAESWYKLGKYEVHLPCSNCYEFVREII